MDCLVSLFHTDEFLTHQPDSDNVCPVEECDVQWREVSVLELPQGLELGLFVHRGFQVLYYELWILDRDHPDVIVESVVREAFVEGAVFDGDQVFILRRGWSDVDMDAGTVGGKVEVVIGPAWLTGFFR